jgi:hypothetical protein
MCPFEVAELQSPLQRRVHDGGTATTVNCCFDDSQRECRHAQRAVLDNVHLGEVTPP